MCIVLIHLSHPDFALVLGANRDEVVKRPACPSHWHNFPTKEQFVFEGDDSIAREIGDDGINSKGPSTSRPYLSGVDAHPSGGGTWLGLSSTGRLGALTNFTEYERPPLPSGRGLTAFRSRGTLVKDWLTYPNEDASGQVGLKQYLNTIAQHRDEWPGFNVFAGYIDADGVTLGYVGNRGDQQGVQYLTEGQQPDTIGAFCSTSPQQYGHQGHALGLSNSTLQTPWSKVDHGKQYLDDALQQYDEKKETCSRDEAEAHLADSIFSALSMSNPVQRREDLRDTILVPPIQMPDGSWYATRVSTVILVRRQKAHADGYGQVGNKNENLSRLAKWWERDIHLSHGDDKPTRNEKDKETQRHFAFDVSIVPP